MMINYGIYGKHGKLLIDIKGGIVKELLEMREMIG